MAFDRFRYCEIVHAVTGGGIVFAIYHGPRSAELARRHSRCMTGVDVTPIHLDELSDTAHAAVCAELRNELPDHVRRDIELSEYEELDDMTPGATDVDVLDE